MPHLKYGNRYWRVAGDEFSVPALCSIAGRLSWSALISIILAISYNSMINCDYGWILVSYLFISILLFAMSILCDIVIMIISLKGSIVQTEKRVDMNRYLTLRIYVGFMQIICAIFGILSLSDTHIPCNPELEGDSLNRAFVAIVVISQMVDVMALCCCCYLFSANKIEEHENAGPRETITAHTVWESRCRQGMRFAQLVTCNLFGGGNVTEGFEEVAKVLTNFFHHDGFLDVVPSDVAAGIVLVRVEQRNRRLHKVTGGQRASGSSKKKNTFTHQDIETGEGTVLNGDTTVHAAAGSDTISMTASPLSFGVGDTCLISSATDEPGSGGGDIHAKPSIFATSTVTNRNSHTQMVNLTRTRTSSDHSAVADLSVVEEMTRCSFFALAMYTHYITVYMKPCSGICRLLSTSACAPERAVRSGSACMAPCCCITGKSRLKRDEDMVIEGDNDCGLNYAGIKVITSGMENTEVVYASFNNNTSHKPYAVILDHQKQYVVVTIRGTLSLEDCITDALCEPAEMDVAGQTWGFDGKDRFAHAGMLRAALHIRGEIEKSNVLNRIYGGGSSVNINSSNSGTGHHIQTPLNKTADYSHYRLMITGHSLGAGTAAILAILLKAAFPKVCCYTFGTPGSVLDKRSSEEYSSFITSVVLSNDIVPRLNFTSICVLRNEILDAICRAKVSKMLVMQAIFRDFDNEELMYPQGQEPDSAFKRSIVQYKTVIQSRLDNLSHTELCLPGKIFLFVKSAAAKDSSWLFGSAKYTLQEASLQDFSFITVSSTMVADHMPDRYTAELTKALNNLVQRV